MHGGSNAALRFLIGCVSNHLFQADSVAPMALASRVI